MGSGIPSNVVLDEHPKEVANIPPNVTLDDHNPISPEAAHVYNAGPEKVASGVVGTLGRALPRIGMQVGGAEGGALLGGAVGGPVGALVGGAIGGGLGNVAGKNLPEEIGGSPDESTLHAFGWGAGPELIARGVAGALETRAARKTSEAAYNNLIEQLDKGANPAPAEQAGKLVTRLGRTTLEAPKPLTGEALSDATNSLRDDILGPITEMRKRLGEPIGQAYESLKDIKEPLDPKQIAEVQEAAQGVRAEMLSPYPKAKAILARIKSLSPPEAPEWARPDYKGEHAPRPVTTEDYAALEKYTEAVKNYKPPTWDDIRELRQANNKILRSAEGGDAHATAGLQQAIDKQLIDKLPAGISRDRELYRSFMNRFPWRDVTRVQNMGTPRELAQYAFGGTPERTAEIIQASSLQGKVALREALTNRVMDAVNPDAPLADQVKAARGALAPYIKNGSAAELYGVKNADQLRNLFYAPEHFAQLKQAVEQPEFKDAVTKEITNLVKSGDNKKIDAVEKGFEKVINSLPPHTRAMFEAPTVPGVQLPALPSTQEAMTQGIKPGAGGMGSRIARRAEFTGPYAVARGISGNPLYPAAQMLTMATVATTSAGYRAIMENGGAAGFAKMMASPSGRMKVRLFLETLGAIGTQAERGAEDSQ